MDPKYRKIHHDMVRHIRDGVFTPQKRLPSEKELATQYGVSVGTVVRALDSLTRDGWLVRRRGSGTFVKAQPVPESSLSAGAFSNIAFVVSSAANVGEHMYFGPIFSGLRETCFSAEVPLIFADVPEVDWLALPKRFPETAFYIVSPRDSRREVLMRLWQAKPCFVVVGASWEQPVPYPTIDSDNRGAARRAVEYLLHLGHRSVIYVDGENDSANCRDRRLGYEDALRAWEITPDPALIIAPEGSMSLGTQAFNTLSDLMLSRQRSTAIFCAGYYLALEVMNVTRQLGISIPEQVSLISMDDARSAEHLQPPLTTLRQPLAEIGGRGAARLVELMRTGTAKMPLAERLPVELILRGSCAAPQK